MRQDNLARVKVRLIISCVLSFVVAERSETQGISPNPKQLNIVDPQDFINHGGPQMRQIALQN